ncbi:MAG TPA: class I SAM-dependent methyltransferase [Thiobacillaceae bacterium]|nr:class I SAM-dependent methyltransferase [Thiobacillaceae bacterium]
MSELAERLQQKYFGHVEHPYRTFEKAVDGYLRPGHTLLDAGCGYTAPVLQKFQGKAARLIGIDMVDFPAEIPGIELYKGDLAHTGLEDASVDLIMCRSVMEHVDDPRAVYREMFRVLRPGGRFIFLTANLWDYASLIAKIVPNSLHPWIVSKAEGRAEMDVFPVRYRTNTYGSVKGWARESGFAIEDFRYLGQYPCYFMFNGFLFWLATGYEKLITKVEALKFLRGWIFVTLGKPAEERL